MGEIKRLINASKSDFNKMKPMDLKEAIRLSEGRTIMGQHLLFMNKGLVHGITNTEIMFAFGADMVMLNAFDLDDINNNIGLCGLTYEELKALGEFLKSNNYNYQNIQ